MGNQTQKSSSSSFGFSSSELVQHYPLPEGEFNAHDQIVRALGLLTTEEDEANFLPDLYQKLETKQPLDQDEIQYISDTFSFVSIDTRKSFALIYKLGVNTWLIRTKERQVDIEESDDDTPIPQSHFALVVWDNLLSFIFSIKRIVSIDISLINFEGRQYWFLYKCDSKSKKCWANREEAAEKIQGLSRGHTARKKTRAKRLSKEIDFLPPIRNLKGKTIFPGGTEYRKAKQSYGRDASDSGDEKED